MRKTMIVLFVFAAAACGGGHGARIVADFQVCPPKAGQIDVGAHDRDQPLPGGSGKSFNLDFMPVGTAQSLSSYEEIAVVQVISRDAPVAAADTGHLGARKSVVHPPPPADVAPPFQVFRPARVVTLRQLKGTVDTCLDLDVPGGTSRRFQEGNYLFPDTFAPGDKMLALFSDNDTPGTRIAPYAQMLLKAAPGGSVTLPFGDHDHINVNTWNPPPYSPPPNSNPPPPISTTTSQPLCTGPNNPTGPPPCGRGTSTP
jgi:hypothetical protein